MGATVADNTDTGLPPGVQPVDTSVTDYGVLTDVGSTPGGLINTAASPVSAPPDASGGNGSYLGVLQNTLTQGLTDAAGAYEDYALGSLSTRYAVNAQAQVATASAQARQVTFQSYLPWVLLAAGIFVVVALVRK